MNIRLKYTHYNKSDLTFLYKPTFKVMMVKEDMSYVPRFTLKDSNLFDNFPTNEPTKFSLDLIKMCIEYGMIINIDYKGDGDSKFDGHNRTIYPMAIGTNKDGKLLLRGYHLKGWSLSSGKVIEKEWRLFRCDRILNMSFMGAFFRLPPEGYNVSGDKSMSKIIKIAKFNDIRKNQETLITKKEIDLQDRVVITKLSNIYVQDLNYNVKLSDPWKDNVVPKKDANNIHVTFAKTVVNTSTNAGVILLGTNIVKNKTFKLYVDGKQLGTYKSIETIMANELDDMSDTLENMSEFKAYLFIEAK